MIATVPNFREVRDLATADGGAVRPGMIFRSGALRTLDPDDAEVLSRLNLALVCDLRSASESEHAPNSWLTGQTIAIAAFDLLAAIPESAGPWPRLIADPTPAGARQAMLALYAAMPAAAGPHVVEIMRLIAAGHVPLLIHCTAGKDRTGVVVAILLTALGVVPDAVIADYLASAGRQTETVAAATRRLAEQQTGRRLDDATIDTLLGVTPDFLAASFRAIDDAFGGVDAYLRAFGAGPDLLVAFRGRLIG